MKINNIEYDTDIDNYKTEKYVTYAMDFLCSICNVNRSCFDLLCIVSEHYPSDVENYRKKSQNDKNNNGAFIPTFFQENNYNDKKNIVIINWGKIEEEKYDEKFIISIFIHEFSHYLDYCLCSKIEEEYNVHFDLNVGQRSPDDLIYQTFHNWSEIRAKYFQTKYYNNKENIISQINDICACINDFNASLEVIYSSSIKNNQEEKEQLENIINYSYLHLLGLILAYEEINNDNISKEIQELKDKLKQNNYFNDLLDAAFNINMLFKLFDKILKKPL